MFSYRAILKQAWQIFRQKKVLWFFGFLALLFGGSVEIKLLQSFLQGGQNALGVEGYLQTGVFNSYLLDLLFKLVTGQASGMSGLIGYLILLVVVLLFVFFLGMIGQLVLIDQAGLAIKNKPSDWRVWPKIKSLILPIAVLNLLISLGVFIAFLLISSPIRLTTSQPTAWADGLYLLLFVLLLPACILLAFVIKYIIAYLIIYKQNWRLAWRNGWSLFVANWLVSAEMALMLFLLHFLGSAVAVLFAYFILPIIFSFLANLLAMLIAPVMFVIIYWLYVVCIFLSLAIIGSLLTAYIIIAWTSLFVKLNKDGGESKLQRLGANLTKTNG